jgi:sugar lactone lactonase YvrE
MALSMIETPRRPRGRQVRRLAVWIGLISLAALSSVRFAGAQALEPGGAVDMGSVFLGASSSNDTVTFTATVNTTIQSVTSVEEGAPTQDFVLVSQNCTGTIQAEHTCSVTVNFTPMKIGLRRGAILIADNTGAIVNQQLFLGVGLGPQLVFSPATSTTLSSAASLTPSTFKTSSAVYDGAGNLYFNDYLNGRILMLAPSNSITSIAAQVGNLHSAMAINGAGLLYVTSPTQGKVSLITSTGIVSTLVTPGITLTSPSGIAVDGGGFIYIADSQANQIVRVAPDSSVASVVPMTGLSTPLSSPYGLAVDHNILYIADSGNGRIVEVSLSDGAVSALTPNNALSQPYGIAVDASGSLVVANAGGSNLVQVSAAGIVSALVGDVGVTLPSSPLGAVVTPSGDIIAADATLGLVFIKRSSGELTFPTPTRQGSFDSTDGFETLTVQNSGNQAIQFSATAPTISSSDFASGATNTCPVLQSTSTPLAIAATCTYTFGFTPSVVGADDATVSVRGTAVPSGFNVTATSQLIATGTTPIDTLQVVATPGATTPNTPVSFTVTAYQGTNIATDFAGAVTFTMTDPTGTFLGGTSYTFKASDNGTHTFPANLGANFDVPGNYTITASFGSIAAASNTVVVRYDSSTALLSSVNPLQAGSQTILTATVSPIATGITPTGTITFYDGTNIVETCTLAAGKCAAPITLSAGNSQTLTAVYSGDNNFAPSTSNAVNEIVNAYNPQVVETSNPNPSAVFQQVMLTATVTAVPGQTGATTPTGTITFMDGTATLGTGTLVSGVATLNFIFTTAGAHSLTAVYDGGTMYNPLTSAIYIQNVTSAYTATDTLRSSINPSAINQSTTFTATIAPAAGQTGAPAPTGTVTFKNGSATLGTGNVVNGVATFSASFAASGSYIITAVYSGDTDGYGSVTSLPLTQVVSGTFTAVATVTTTTNPSTVGQSVEVNGTLQPTPGQTNPPALTGTVTFYDGATILGTAPVSGNYASGGPITFTTTGNHNLTLVYSGDSNYAGVTSTIYVQVVDGNNFTAVAAVTTATNPSTVGQSVQVSGILQPTPGQTNPPALTGTVAFYDGTTRLGTAPVNGNYAGGGPITFTTTGNHNLTLVYSGDGNYPSVTSPIYVQMVNANPFPATVALTSSASPAFINNSVTFSATVTSSGTPAATGSVAFMNGTTPLGSATIINGVATLPAAFPLVNTYSITAVYSGDTNYATASSPTFNQVIEDFSLTPATPTGGTATVVGGTPATYTFTLAPVGGTTLAGPIAFSLSGFPTGSVFNFSPASVATGTGTTTVTLTITPPIAQAMDRNRPTHPRSNGVVPIAFAFLALPFTLIFGRKRRRPAALLLWLMLFASAFGLTGCLSASSSGYYGNDTPGTYTLNVTATSGALSHSAGVTLVRQ